MFTHMRGYHTRSEHCESNTILVFNVFQAIPHNSVECRLLIRAARELGELLLVRLFQHMVLTYKNSGHLTRVVDLRKFNLGPIHCSFIRDQNNNMSNPPISPRSFMIGVKHEPPTDQIALLIFFGIPKIACALFYLHAKDCE